MAKRIVDPKADRKRKLEELKREQRSRERRKTLVTVGIATLLGLGLIAAVVTPAVLKDQRLKTERKADERDAKLPVANFGVKAADANCSAETTDNPIPAGGDHSQEGERVDYAVSPPSGGRHSAGGVLGQGTGFFARSASSPPERAVHSLEHGGVIVWYDKTVPDDQVKALRKIGVAGVNKSLRLIVVPWERGDFADDKHIVLTSWGHRQACGAPSGEAIEAFVKKNADSEVAPERGGQI
ncbi:MAG: DUF3105 domain-containing protein [Mycobacteriales bacterium]